MTDDTRPLGKSVEEIEREAGNLDPEHTPHDDGRLHGGVMIPPTGLGGAGGTATGTGTGFPLMPTGHRGGQTPEDDSSESST